MPYTDLEFKFKKIGRNVEIGRNVYFRYPHLVEIGDNTIIDEFCMFTTEVKIGSFVHVAPHVSIIGGKASKVIVGDFVGLASGTRIVCGSDNYDGDGMTNPTIPEEFRATVVATTVDIGNHCVLGTNTVVHPGVKIGEGACTGSLTLVTKDLDPWVIYVGIPARKAKDRRSDIILEHEKNLRRKIAEGLL